MFIECHTALSANKFFSLLNQSSLLETFKYHSLIHSAKVTASQQFADHKIGIEKKSQALSSPDLTFSIVHFNLSVVSNHFFLSCSK